MQFFNRSEQEIRSLKDWERLGKPAARHHWKPGRSAYELAADWIDGNAVERATKLLSLRPELANAELIEGIAEKKTRGDPETTICSSAPRQARVRSSSASRARPMSLLTIRSGDGGREPYGERRTAALGSG
jgi:hypothetical protein